MNLPNFPNIVWWVFGMIALLVVMAIFKADFSVGSQGIHFTQGLIR